MNHFNLLIYLDFGYSFMLFNVQDVSVVSADVQLHVEFVFFSTEMKRRRKSLVLLHIEQIVSYHTCWCMVQTLGTNFPFKIRQTIEFLV